MVNNLHFLKAICFLKHCTENDLFYPPGLKGLIKVLKRYHSDFKLSLESYQKWFTGSCVFYHLKHAVILYNAISMNLSNGSEWVPSEWESKHMI